MFFSFHGSFVGRFIINGKNATGQTTAANGRVCTQQRNETQLSSTSTSRVGFELMSPMFHRPETRCNLDTSPALNIWSRVALQKLIVALPVDNSPVHFMGSEVSLPYSQKPANCFRPEPYETSQHIPTSFFLFPSSIYASAFKAFSSLRAFQPQIFPETNI